MSRSLLVLLVVAACGAGTPGPGIDVDRAMAHVRSLLAIGPRPGDTEESRRARAYIEHELAAMGATVEEMEVGDVDLPAVRVLGQMVRTARRAHSADPNLLVRFGPTRGKALLVMAHYDTVATSPGAVDNAAAVGVVLELARVLATRPPPVPVVLAFTANEEVGLVGAEALAARRGGEIGFAIALDLVGGTGDLVINGASTRIGAAELEWLAAAADRAGVVLRAPLAHPVAAARLGARVLLLDRGVLGRSGSSPTSGGGYAGVLPETAGPDSQVYGTMTSNFPDLPHRSNALA